MGSGLDAMKWQKKYLKQSTESRAEVTRALEEEENVGWFNAYGVSAHDDTSGNGHW